MTDIRSPDDPASGPATHRPPRDASTPSSPWGRMVASWALLGVATLFAFAVYRLGRRGLEAIDGGLDPLQWAALVLLTVGFVYGEGVRALDRRWIPGLVRRARRLRGEGRLLQLLGPLYGLSLVGTERGDLVRGWLNTSAIVVAVLLVRSFPSPWRGIVDFAVAGALVWGMIAILRRMPTAVR
jgi:hypothetical protein